MIRNFLLFIFLLGFADACSPNCLQCDGTYCVACGESYVLTYDGQCINATIDNCAIYYDSQTCQICNPTYSLENQVCVKMYDGCVQINEFDFSCQSCMFGKVLNNSQCVGSLNCINNAVNCSTCQKGFTLSGGICLDTTNSCLSYDKKTGVCSNCKPQYSLVGYQCVSNSVTVPFCIIYTPDGKCQICNSGFNLTNSYTCVIEESNSTNNLNQANNSSTNLSNITNNCQVLSQSDQNYCIQCDDRYYSLNGTCQPVSTYCDAYNPVNGICLSCTGILTLNSNGSCYDSYCLSGQVGNCSQCTDAFSISSGLCIYNDTHCQAVINNEPRCDTCNTGYFVGIQGTCQPIPLGCSAPDINTGACLQCNQGFALLSNGKCSVLIKISNCLSVDQENGTCQMCNTGYFPQGQVCKKVSALCIGSNPQTGACLKCLVGYVNNGGACIDPNCQSQVGDECKMCSQNFKSDTPSSICKFYDPNCASLTNLGCNSCKKGYALGLQICLPIPANCLAIGSSGTCTQCSIGYSLFSSTCILPIKNCVNYVTNGNQTGCGQCSLGYLVFNNGCIKDNVTQTTVNSLNTSNQISNLSGTISLKDPNCAKYSGQKCTNCSARYYFGPGGQCLPVNPNCKSFDVSSGNCTDCYTGFKIFGSTCTIVGANYDKNCKNFNANGSCTLCYSNYFVSNGVCQPFNPLCNGTNLTNGNCLSCYKGYTLRGGQCVTFYKDPNCLKFDANNNCVNCSQRYYLKGNTCQIVNSLCQNYNSSNGQCTSCYSGYRIQSGFCVTGVSSPSDINCKQKDPNNNCIACYANYYLSINNTCLQANPQCKTINNTNGACTQCYSGYIIKNNTCITPTAGLVDPNCLNFNSGVCQQCYSGYQLVAGSCSITSNECKTTNSSNGLCTSCYVGYQLSSGQCLIPQPMTVQAINPYCVKVSGSTCVQCANTYYLSNNACYQVNSLCKGYEPTNGNCLGCYSGYNLQNGNCVQVQNVYIPYCQQVVNTFCVQCIEGYYISDPQTCTAVSILCATYSQTTGECETCIEGYFWQNNTCIYPALGVDPNCIIYGPSAYCSQCAVGYYISSYACVPVDPNCYIFDYTNSVCTQCVSGKQLNAGQCF